VAVFDESDAEAIAAAGVVVPTASRPTTAMTPTENDAAATRWRSPRHAGGGVRRHGRRPRRGNRPPARQRSRDAARASPREGEQAGSELELVEVAASDAATNAESLGSWSATERARHPLRGRRGGRRHGDRGRVLGGDRFEHGSRGAAQTPTGGFVGLCADDGFGDDRRSDVGDDRLGEEGSAGADSARLGLRHLDDGGGSAGENVVRGSGHGGGLGSQATVLSAGQSTRPGRRCGRWHAARASHRPRGCRGSKSQALVRPRGRLRTTTYYGLRIASPFGPAKITIG
jgi:hypothetical protein